MGMGVSYGLNSSVDDFKKVYFLGFTIEFFAILTLTFAKTTQDFLLSLFRHGHLLTRFSLDIFKDSSLEDKWRILRSVYELPT